MQQYTGKSHSKHGFELEKIFEKIDESFSLVLLASDGYNDTIEPTSQDTQTTG
jgi:hypothetical protein